MRETLLSKDNYIECGDCLGLLKELPDKCIDLVVTDPPYVLYTSGGGYIQST